MRSITKFFVAAIALSVLLAACGGGDADPDAASVEPSVDSTTTSPPTTAAEVESEPEATTTTAAESEPAAPTTTVDARTPEEIALDDLDIMVVQLAGADDLIRLSDCVVERLDSEGVPLVGQGSPELVALLGCEPDIIRSLIGIPASIPPDTGECLLTGIGGWIADLPLLEGEAFFQSASPPAELVAQLSGDCDVPESTISAVLG